MEIDPETVCFLIIKAREFDVKVDPVEPDPGSNPADGGVREVLEDYADDSTYDELKAFLEALNEEDGTLTRGLKKIVPGAVSERYSALIEAAYETS